MAAAAIGGEHELLNTAQLHVGALVVGGVGEGGAAPQIRGGEEEQQAGGKGLNSGGWGGARGKEGGRMEEYQEKEEGARGDGGCSTHDGGRS